MAEDDTNKKEQGLRQSSAGEQSPNVRAGGDVNIHFESSPVDKESERAASEAASKKEHSTAIKVALIGAGAAIVAGLIAVIGDLIPSESSGPSKGGTIEITAPVIHSGSGTQVIATGDVAITEGVPQVVVDRLLKTLDEKDVALEERASQLETLVVKYKALEKRLAEREDAESQRARALLEEGKLDEAEAVFKASLATRLENLEKERELAAADAYELGVLHDLRLDYAGAKRYYEQAVELDSGNSLYLNGLGLLEHRLGNHKKAIGLYDQSLAINRAVYGDEHPNVATGLNNVGMAWYSLGENQKAIGLLEQALAIDRTVYGEAHPTVARELNNLGMAWDSLGEHQKAIGLHEQALAINRTVYGDEHPDVATNLINLGGVWDSLGEYQKAIGLYEQAEAYLWTNSARDTPLRKRLPNFSPRQELPPKSDD